MWNALRIRIINGFAVCIILHEVCRTKPKKTERISKVYRFCFEQSLTSCECTSKWSEPAAMFRVYLNYSFEFRRILFSIILLCRRVPCRYLYLLIVCDRTYGCGLATNTIGGIRIYTNRRRQKKDTECFRKSFQFIIYNDISLQVKRREMVAKPQLLSFECCLSVPSVYAEAFVYL